MATYIISIKGAPSGTYTKVKTILGDPEIWDYKKPEFTFEGDSGLLAAVMTIDGVELVSGGVDEAAAEAAAEPESEPEPEPELKTEPEPEPEAATFSSFTPPKAASPKKPAPAPAPSPVDLTGATFSVVADGKRVVHGPVPAGATLASLLAEHGVAGALCEVGCYRNGSRIAGLSKVV